MECVVKWGGEMSFVAETESGHKVVMDASPEVGGQNLGARPMELMLASTGGCSGIDVIMILKKARQQVTGCEIRLSGERAAMDPKVFTRIHLHYVVTGVGLKGDIVDRAVRLSADKYCSASAMLAKSAQVTHDWEIVEA